MANSDKTRTVKLGEVFVDLVEKYKNETRVPIGRFIEDAIVEKVDRLPNDVKQRMGIKKPKNKK